METRVSAVVILFCLAGLCLSDGCSDDDKLIPSSFSGITETDEEGRIISEDPGDWCFTPEDTTSLVYVRTDLEAFSLPCSTLGDSAQQIITFENAYHTSVTVTCRSTACALGVRPDSASVPSRSTLEFTATYKYDGEDIANGEIVFCTDAPEDSLTVIFDAGRVPYWVQPGSLPVTPLPSEAMLYPAYPNPASGAVSLRFVLPAGQPVIIDIYAPGGYVMEQIADRYFPAGEHRITWEFTDIAPGIYKCYLATPGFDCQGDIEVQ